MKNLTTSQSNLSIVIKRLTTQFLPVLVLLTAGVSAVSLAEGNNEDNHEATSKGSISGMPAAIANEKIEFKRHTFGTQIAAGGVEFEGIDTDNGGVGQFYSYYNYAVNRNFAIELGINIGGDIDDWECREVSDNDWHCTDLNHDLFGQGIDDIEFTSVVLAAKGILPLSKRNSLYGKLGIHNYHYDLFSNNHKVADDSGIGLYLAAGWEYRWDSGLGLNVGYEAYDMDDLETFTLNTGLSYQF